MDEEVLAGVSRRVAVHRSVLSREAETIADSLAGSCVVVTAIIAVQLFTADIAIVRAYQVF
jgi:hypothetical protein